jgi:hypothetical protein
MVLEETLPILNEVIEVFIELTMGWCPLTTWVSVSRIANKFILGCMQCAPMMCLWIWYTMYHDWAKKKCHCGVLGQAHIPPPI